MVVLSESLRDGVQLVEVDHLRADLSPELTSCLALYFLVLHDVNKLCHRLPLPWTKLRTMIFPMTD